VGFLPLLNIDQVMNEFAVHGERYRLEQSSVNTNYR
jgi:hypothetical protein